MPRKKTIIVDNKNVKKNLINTMLKENTNDDEHIILQLPLSPRKINNIININNESNIIINNPTPYENNSYFLNDLENIVTDKENFLLNNKNVNTCCFWCCYKIDKFLYGMPVSYDSINDTYLMYGSFCSLQCANAYNFSINSGSDKVWEINSLIQMLSKRYGFVNSIRPAPSKYLLKMFNGNLTIEEFRNAHLTDEKTYILNIPPMISLTTNIEILNTSYIPKITDIKEKDKNIFSNNKKNDIRT